MNKRAFSIYLVVSILILGLSACSNNGFLETTSRETTTAEPEVTKIQADAIVEHALIEIPLPDSIASASMEYSGLAWYGETLILLPQYPNGMYGNQAGFLYAIDQEDLSAFLIDPSTELPVNAIAFDDAGLSKQLDGFEGFEAIVFIEDSVYLTIETHGGNPMKSFVVNGMVESDGNEIKSIQLDGSSLVELTVQNNNSNASYEALTSDGKFIYAFFEQNGEDQNQRPYAVKLDSDLESWQEVTVDFINYRLTDATLMDKDGGIWVVNYFFPGDTHLEIDEDPISTSFGLGDTHQKNKPVERLVKFNFSQERFVLADEPPLYLQLLNNDEARNWEGIVLLDNLGFLLISDSFPGSLLGFCPILRYNQTIGKQNPNGDFVE